MKEENEMTKKSLDTKKCYIGYPIFLLGYKDDTWGYNYTTCSSSYTLGNQLNIGIVHTSNASKQIAKYGSFTLNIPTKEYLKEIAIGGFYSGEDKFRIEHAFHYEVSDLIDAPVIRECCMTLECTVNQIVENQGISHIFATIERWMLEEYLVQEGHLNIEQFNPVIYMGDSYKRGCRFLADDVQTLRV